MVGFPMRAGEVPVTVTAIVFAIILGLGRVVIILRVQDGARKYKRKANKYENTD
jgi:hypothetical protein